MLLISKYTRTTLSKGENIKSPFIKGGLRGILLNRIQSDFDVSLEQGENEAAKDA